MTPPEPKHNLDFVLMSQKHSTVLADRKTGNVDYGISKFKEIEIYPMRELSYDFIGIHFEESIILAAAPSTDDLDMVRRGYRWDGLVLFLRLPL